jgi:hypothetical protein
MASVLRRGRQMDLASVRQVHRSKAWRNMKVCCDPKCSAEDDLCESQELYNSDSCCKLDFVTKARPCLFDDTVIGASTRAVNKAKYSLRYCSLVATILSVDRLQDQTSVIISTLFRARFMPTYESRTRTIGKMRLSSLSAHSPLLVFGPRCHNSRQR